MIMPGCRRLTDRIVARLEQHGLMLSALDLARRIEAGALTPRAVVEMCAEAIAAREGEIGAFTALDIEAARRTADSLAVAAAARPAGRHEGHLRHRRFPDRVRLADLCRPSAEGDAAMVMAVRRAGGVILGKTVTTEFASLQPAGTRNPRNPAHTPGGSSSGSAAAIAAGMLPIAFGSQTGGSVIRPAAYCGVAGYKPSFRLLPTVGMKTFSWSLDTVGMFGAGVEDVAFAAAATTGRDLRVDGATLNAPSIALASHAPVVGSDARHAGRRRARGARRRSRRRARDRTGAAGDLRGTRSAATASCRTTKPSARSLTNTTGTATGSARSWPSSSARPPPSPRINMTKRGAPPGARGRLRRPDGEDRRHPHAFGHRRRTARARRRPASRPSTGCGPCSARPASTSRDWQTATDCRWVSRSSGGLPATRWLWRRRGLWKTPSPARIS